MIIENIRYTSVYLTQDTILATISIHIIFVLISYLLKYLTYIFHEFNINHSLINYCIFEYLFPSSNVIYSFIIYKLYISYLLHLLYMKL